MLSNVLRFCAGLVFCVAGAFFVLCALACAVNLTKADEATYAVACVVVGLFAAILAYTCGRLAVLTV